jgi:hydroxyethylthiazole kinase-like uncharacterized protein yjeF
VWPPLASKPHFSYDPGMTDHAFSASQMRDLDRKASEIYGVPGLVLMENAGRGTANLILQKFHPRNVLILCGKGNNGGDGFVIARYLAEHKIGVEVMLLSEVSEIKGDAAVNFKGLKDTGVTVRGFAKDMGAYDVLVDAILGLGLKSEVAGIYKEAIEAVNASGKPVVAVDIASGLDADDGTVHGAAVKASMTATMAALKHGLLKGKGPEHSGEITVIDIGLPQDLLDS